MDMIEIRCRRIIHATYRGAIITRLECDLAVSHVLPLRRKRDCQEWHLDKQEVKIIHGGTGDGCARRKKNAIYM